MRNRIASENNSPSFPESSCVRACSSAPVNASGTSKLQRPTEEEVEGGLFRLCEEVAGTLLRRVAENSDAAAAVRAVRRDLFSHLPDCDMARAGHLIDLALELIRVKSRGRYLRNPLELSELVARAGRRLRNSSDN